MFTLSRFHKPQFWLSIFKGKVGGKYLKRWQVTDPRTGKNKWVYKYKPISQRGAHEITKDRFRKVTKIADETHRAAVEKALQDGHSISMRILKDYPDLVQKYNKTAKVRNFDRISAKVKEAKQKIESAKDQFSAKENDLIERSLNLYNSKNKNEQAKLKKQLEDGIQSGNGSDSDARAGKELIRRINEQEARSIPKKEIPKPSYNTELDKARKEKDPKTKWRNLKAILDKAKAENNVPEGLEQEVKDSGKAMLNHALSGEWESKTPKKEINIDSMNPKEKKKNLNEIPKTPDNNTMGEQENMRTSETQSKKTAVQTAKQILKEAKENGFAQLGRAKIHHELKYGKNLYSAEFPFNEYDIATMKKIKGSWYSESVSKGARWYFPEEKINDVVKLFGEDAVHFGEGTEEDFKTERDTQKINYNKRK